jgi:putative ABC transport system substrate-binding protein
MRRREFLGALSDVAAWSTAARAEQAVRARRIAVVMGTADTDSDQKALVSVFTQALAALGWNEGTNIDIEYRWAAGDTARLRAYAAELARLAPDAIFVRRHFCAGHAGSDSAPTKPLVRRARSKAPPERSGESRHRQQHVSLEAVGHPRAVRKIRGPAAFTP